MSAVRGEVIQNAVSEYYERARESHHRYKSWEHCYRFFSSRRFIDKDIACLHLAFYLASWGMLRGSTQLLQKDYKIHEEAVDLMLDPQFDCLLALSLADAQKNKDNLFELIGRLRGVYQCLLGKDNGGIPSDTLVTKVLLGTLGCIPAYDTLFVRGLRQAGLSCSGLRMSNFQRLIAYCQDHEEPFRLAQAAINQTAAQDGLHYPMMKIIDMCFWMRGGPDFQRESGLVPFSAG